MKRAHDIKQFHVAVVPRRLRNVQNSVTHMLFAVLITVVIALAPYCCDPKILVPW